MKYLFKHFLAINASVAYLGMLSGFGMLLFTYAFFYLLFNDSTLPVILHGFLTYLMLVLGPGAIILAAAFYYKIRQPV